MPKLKRRESPLSQTEQHQLISFHIPGRIQTIQATLQRASLDYGSLAGAAVLTRAIAGFLGLATRSGRLCKGDSYFQHEPNKSWEAKLSDIAGGNCISLDTLTAQQRAVVEAGINETNLAFAHLTFWSDLTNQDANGRARIDYQQQQVQRIRDFAYTIIELYNKHTSKLLTSA